jgi:hypothetical protein
MTGSIGRWALMLWLGCWIACAAATLQWLRSIPPGQDVRIYQEAAARAHQGRSPYLPIDIGGEGYTYHPAQLLLVRVLAPPGAGFPWIWFFASAAAWIASLRLVNECLSIGLRSSPAGPRWLWIVSALTFGPLLETLYLGQIDTIVTLAVILALWLLLRGADWPAGASLAVAIVLKASPVLLLLHFAAVRRWKALVAACAVVGGLTALPAAVYSPRLLLEYRQVVSAISGSLPPLFYNQSAISVLYRAIREFVPQASFLTRNMGAPLAAVLSAAALWPAIGRPPTPAMMTSSFAALWIVALIASPLVWYHHHVFLLASVGVALCSASRAARTLAVAGASFVQVQRALELAGGSRWLGALSGEFAVGAAVAICLWTSMGSEAQQGRSAWIAERRS